ncbi:MAG: hypothetical protein IKU37_02350 [Candidatus Gastranaerophilales bacterium]|nr:hypothetical protein [Candidatus Gastranaerophilales bacterium]
MIEAKITKKALIEFLKNLRYQDKLEMNEFFKSYSLDDFLNICLEKNNFTYFLFTDDNKPLALGGAYKVKNKIARIWFLATNEIDKYKISLYKYVLNKISYFKQRFDFLYNFIFKSNFSSLSWLKKSGFLTIDLDTPDYKLFYFNKGEKIL